MKLHKMFECFVGRHIKSITYIALRLVELSDDDDDQKHTKLESKLISLSFYSSNIYNSLTKVKWYSFGKFTYE